MRERVLLIPLFAALFLTGWLLPAQAGEFTVHGVGYPPIKATNTAQALLMARRAAILDGYATALRRQQAVPENLMAADQFFFDDLTGFIRSAEVVKQTYYADGRVEVVIKGKTDIAGTTDVSSVKKNNRPGKAVRPANMKPVAKSPPQQVSQQQWLAIIEKIVQLSTPVKTN